jgi:hypothetical protein
LTIQRNRHHWLQSTERRQPELVDLYSDTVTLTIQEVRVMVFNATFNNISVISCDGFIGGGKRSTQRKPPTSRKSLTNLFT